jgi:hypothetical protein
MTPDPETSWETILEQRAEMERDARPTAETVKTPGRVACEEWTRFHGSPHGFKSWDELPERVQAAWESVARAVLGWENPS